MKRYFIAICIFFIANSVMAQMTNSYGSMLHTYDGRTLNPGKFVIYNNTNFFSRASKLIDETAPIGEFKPTNYWTVGDNLSISYGIIRHLDVSLGIRLYQDTNLYGENLPDDLFLNIRSGAFTFGNGHFYNAGILGFRFPTGKYHNYLWSEFSSGSFMEYGVKWALTYYSDKYLMDKKFNLHINIGYWNHNEKGVLLYGDNMKGSVNSSSIDLLFAAIFPTQYIDYRIEINNMFYLTSPDSFVYSRDYYTYFSPSIKYKASKNFFLDFGVDFRLSGDNYDIPKWMRHPAKTVDMPKMYVPWKVNFGIGFTFGNLDEAAYFEQEEEKQKVKVLNKVHEEEIKSQKTQSEIMDIKELSNEIDNEIEKLQKKLED